MLPQNKIGQGKFPPNKKSSEIWGEVPTQPLKP